MKSHPTIYRGTQFRSRLEARWAAFFDLVGWRWRYEPFDLEGWTPDFLLSRACTDDVLIEVKPLVFRGDEQDFTIDRCPATRPDVLAAASKIDRAISGSQWQALLLGAFPFEGVPSFGKKFLCAGLIGENYDNGECLWWQQAVFVGHGGDEYHYADGFSLQPEFGRWNHRVDEWIGSESSYLIDLWAEAANSTMWQPRGGRLHEPLPA